LLWVVTSASVQVAPKDTWVSLTTQEDHGISERLEARGNPTLEPLTNLLSPNISHGLCETIVM
jgi:hypothetical protein